MAKSKANNRKSGKKAKTNVHSTAYEEFVQEIHQDLLRQTELKNVTVQHNIKLPGKSGAPYQIDVFWEFALGGTQYRTCIECKQYNTSVKRSAINAFADALDDIGNVNGIFVTTVGYQEGAKTLARHARNIRLLVINPIIRRIDFKFRPTQRVFAWSDLVVNVDAFRALAIGQSKPSGWIWNVNLLPHTMLLDERGNPAISAKRLVESTIATEGLHCLSLRGLYLPSEVGLVPLVSMSVRRSLQTLESDFSFDIGGGAKAIMEDVLANTAEYVNEDGTREPFEKF